MALTREGGKQRNGRVRIALRCIDSTCSALWTKVEIRDQYLSVMTCDTGIVTCYDRTGNASNEILVALAFHYDTL